MIKKWNQFNESMAEKPGPNVPGSVKITMSAEEASSFSDEPVLSKLIYDDKISLLGNDIWYLESDAQTKGILDTYLEMSGENRLEEVTESKKPTKSSSFDEKHEWMYKNIPEYKKEVDELIDKFLKETKKKDKEK